MPEATLTPAPTGAEPPVTQTPPASIPPAAPDKPAASTERPAWLPEGFDSPEALAAAYEQLKKPQSNEPDPDPSNTPAPTADESVTKFVQDSGLDPVALSREIATAGDISAEAKTALSKKLEKAGLPASMIDEYITGQKYAMDAAVKDIMSVAGGQESYNEMARWASENLSEAELKAFESIMMNADVNTAKLTVGNLYARYKGNAAIPGQRLKGTTGTTGGDIFHSWEQQVAAQSDPRYAKDPAFRTEVERKIERTIKAGGYRVQSR